MPIYVDESGGLPSGAMTMAGVDLDEAAALALLARFRAITGLRGELKGSRIDLVERALVFELLERFGGRVHVCVIERAEIAHGTPPQDIDIYVGLLRQLVDGWLSDDRGCTSFVIDQGRYDQLVEVRVRADINRLLAACGTASMVDSRSSAGVQVADVVANCFFNLATRSPRAERIERIVGPFVESGVVRVEKLRWPASPARA